MGKKFISIIVTFIVYINLFCQNSAAQQQLSEEDAALILEGRLHLLRLLNACCPNSARILAQETLRNYTALAWEFGWEKLKDELEDISFEILYPQIRNHIINLVNTRFGINGDNNSTETFELILQEFKDDLRKYGLDYVEVVGRQKSPFSIWQKMIRKNRPISGLRDVFGFKIVVKTIDDCYTVISIIRQLYHEMVGTFKDYIKYPKPDTGYQSLHTSVIGPYNKTMEIQVRTEEMNDKILKEYLDYWKSKTSFHF